jgi:hypothetical protein
MQSACQNYGTIVDLWDTGSPAKTLNGTKYEEWMFMDRITEIISNHNSSENLFLMYTPHIAHCPLQVPQEWLQTFAFVPDDEPICMAQTPYIFPGSNKTDYRCRAQYETLVAILDANVKNITDNLKAKGYWNDSTYPVQSSIDY